MSVLVLDSEALPLVITVGSPEVKVLKLSLKPEEVSPRQWSQSRPLWALPPPAHVPFTPHFLRPHSPKEAKAALLASPMGEMRILQTRMDVNMESFVGA